MHLPTGCSPVIRRRSARWSGGWMTRRFRPGGHISDCGDYAVSIASYFERSSRGDERKPQNNGFDWAMHDRIVMRSRTTDDLLSLVDKPKQRESKEETNYAIDLVFRRLVQPIPITPMPMSMHMDGSGMGVSVYDCVW
jgi:hypothetical protein